MAAITTPQWPCVLLTTMLIMLRSSWLRKCEWGKRKGGGWRKDTNIGTHTCMRTHSLEVVCSSQWSVYFRADEPEVNPNGMKHGDHPYLMKNSLFNLSYFNVCGSRDGQWKKLNSLPIIFWHYFLFILFSLTGEDERQTHWKNYNFN